MTTAVGRRMHEILGFAVLSSTRVNPVNKEMLLGAWRLEVAHPSRLPEDSVAFFSNPPIRRKLSGSGYSEGRRLGHIEADLDPVRRRVAVTYFFPYGKNPDADFPCFRKTAAIATNLHLAFLLDIARKYPGATINYEAGGWQMNEEYLSRRGLSKTHSVEEGIAKLRAYLSLWRKKQVRRLRGDWHT